MYSDDFLNQEVEIEEDLLTEEELKYLKDVCNVYNYDVNKSYIEKSTRYLCITLIVDNLNILCFRVFLNYSKLQFNNIEHNKIYYLKDLFKEKK